MDALVTLLVPPGPRGGRLAQTVALHRDPLGFLRDARAAFGDVFTIRLATTGPVVVVADAELAAGIPEGDPDWAHAGEARRGVLPMASPRSVFGADGEEHRAARHRIADLFVPDAVAGRRDAMAAIAAEHVARWPRGRPLRALPRMRAIADAIFVREVLGVRGVGAEPLARAIGRLLWTPGNPPVTVPGPDQGMLGWLVDREFRRRRARVAALIEAEIAERRRRGDAGDGVLGRVVAVEPELAPPALVEELLSLLMAAQEPMAAALTWSLLCVLGSGDEGLRDAIAEHGVDRDPGGAAVREALRLHPSALASLRTLTADRQVGGVALQAGTTVMVPLPLLQRDARYHDEPDAFRPDRPAPRSEHALLPFGGGARRCLGEPLAFAELSAVLPVVLRAARWRTAGPQPERMVLRATILVPQRGGLIRS
jgi:cytochrome P450